MIVRYSSLSTSLHIKMPPVPNDSEDIIDLFHACRESFKEFFISLSKQSEHERIEHLRDEAGRFRIWAENSGAHRARRERVSLDYRLRKASKVKRIVLELLHALNNGLQIGMKYIAMKNLFVRLIICYYYLGAKLVSEPESLSAEPEEIDSWSSDSSISSFPLSARDSSSQTELDTLPASKLEDCFIDIDHVITCLYDFSIAIQNPDPRTDFKNAQRLTYLTSKARTSNISNTSALKQRTD